MYLQSHRGAILQLAGARAARATLARCASHHFTHAKLLSHIERKKNADITNELESNNTCTITSLLGSVPTSLSACSRILALQNTSASRCSFAQLFRSPCSGRCWITGSPCGIAARVKCVYLFLCPINLRSRIKLFEVTLGNKGRNRTGCTFGRAPTCRISTTSTVPTLALRQDASS